MKKNFYDVMAWIARYFLPAATALWVAVAKIWQLPYGVEIAGTAAAITTFLNAILGISSASYWNKHEIVESEPDNIEEL